METVAIYLKVSKTLRDRLNARAKERGESGEALIERLVRLGLLIDAMPDGSNIYRRRAHILGVDTEYVPYIPDNADPTF